jgi:orotate phosphoribosyltransferase-like protein
MTLTGTQLLEKGFRSLNWVQKNFDELAKKYEGKLVAVEDEEVIAAGDTMGDLIRQIEEKGKNPAEVYITSFPPRDSIWVL